MNGVIVVYMYERGGAGAGVNFELRVLHIKIPLYGS